MDVTESHDLVYSYSTVISYLLHAKKRHQVHKNGYHSTDSSEENEETPRICVSLSGVSQMVQLVITMS